MNRVEFRFYEELNDFLPVDRKKRFFHYDFNGNPSVKDAIEAIGVPHTEVDLVLVNGGSVDFSYLIQDGDTISVYPVFESIDITPVIRLREKPLRDLRFIADASTGRLVRLLRMLGFDVLFYRGSDRYGMVDISVDQGRVILTRGTFLLKNSRITRAYCVRSDDPEEQLKEVIARFDLKGVICPFTRCLECNGGLATVDKEKVLDQLLPETQRDYNEFWQCDSCGKVYWKGSHYERMKEWVEGVLK